MLNKEIRYDLRFLDRLFSLESLVGLYFIILLMFGKSFTKFSVIGPVYLHDLSLFLLTVLSLNRGKLRFRFPAVVLLLALAVIYLMISLLFFNLHGEYLVMAFRQFNLFVYLACSYIIFNALVRDAPDVFKAIYLIRFIALFSVALQLIYLVYGYFFIPKFSLFRPLDYNYFSPLVVFGIITYAAYIIAYEERIFMMLVKFLFCILLSTTLGHASAFLAIFIIFLLFFFLKITPLQRMIALGIVLLPIILLFLLPQFRDVNVGWRVLYWKYILARAIKSKYLLFGSGFGQPFVTYDFAKYMQDVLGSSGMVDEYYPMGRYLNPPHNSFLTIVFHVGLIPALLIFFPLKPVFSQLLLKAFPTDNSKLFLLLTLAGCIIWISFNVILELPHSATYFWLVFFTTIYYFQRNPNNKSAAPIP